MTLPLILLWIVIISAFTLGGAFYARKYNKADALIALYVTLILFANIAAGKTISFDLGFTTVFAPAVVIIFAITFLITDIVNEKFGKRETQKMILIALFSQIALVIFSYIILKAVPAPFFQNQQAFEMVLGTVPRIVLASLIAFFVSENTDAYLFQWFKNLTGGRHLWMRNAFSSLPSMALDSAIFVSLAFYGIMPVLPLIIGQSLIKWLVGIVNIPFMYLSRNILKEK